MMHKKFVMLVTYIMNLFEAFCQNFDARRVNTKLFSHVNIFGC
jgi:hypothetical protein